MIMENPIPISNLNDFIFCPASVYFHRLYDGMGTLLFQDTPQIGGTNAHTAIEEGKYSTRKNILQAMPVYSEQYNLIGKIDLFDCDSGILTERKKKITRIYDGYIFQIYGQCIALREMGYIVKQLRLYSKDDNKTHLIPLPEDDPEMFRKFTDIIMEFGRFELTTFNQSNQEKCNNCIYEPACYKSLCSPREE